MVKNSKTRGFSLIELMVVCGIIVLMTAIVFANNNRFSSKVVLQNLAYDTALTIRQAQVYGISVARCPTCTIQTSTTFSSAYGAHFTIDGTSFLIFADDSNPQDGAYTSGVDDTIGSAYTISGGYKISDLCISTNQGGLYTCRSAGISSLDVVFQRPNPDACISANGSQTFVNGACNNTNTNARIYLQSPQGETAIVQVNLSGQIQVL